MLKKVLLGVLGVVVLAVVSLVVYVELSWNKTYDVPLPNLKASTDPEVIERGKYLVHGPAHCSNCHTGSFEEFKRADSGEDIPLRGGVVFPMPPLGQMSPPNLTPDPETGIGRYSDGQLFRLLRNAVKPDGTATLALMMPFSEMADEDHVAIVSYLRSLTPIKNLAPEREFTFMGKLIRTFAPPFQPVFDPKPPAKAPPMEPTKERGRYISENVANCFACHTNHDQATFEQIGPGYGGGMEMEPLPGMGFDPKVWSRSPNLTPHPTGILDDYGSLEKWIARFRAGRSVPHSPMHWGPFTKMTDTDLEALWIFFNSLEPVDYDPGPMVFTKE